MTKWAVKLKGSLKPMATNPTTSTNSFLMTFKCVTTFGVRPLFGHKGFIAGPISTELLFQTKKFTTTSLSCKTQSIKLFQALYQRIRPKRVPTENVSFAKSAWNYSNPIPSVTTVNKSTSQTLTLWTASSGSVAWTVTNGTMQLVRLTSAKIRIWN